MSKEYFYKIITDVNKLSVRDDEVAPDAKLSSVKNTIKIVKQTLKAHPELPALCAKQIGHNKRIFCMRFADGTIKTFVNPLITFKEGLHISLEKNVSLGDHEYMVIRHNVLRAMYQNEKGGIEENKFEGMASEVFEQMSQLLDGILISDFGMEIFKDFHKASEEEKEEVIKLYLDWVKQFDESLNEEIENTPELKDIKQAMEFLASVAKGETDVVPEYNGVVDESQSTKARIDRLNQMDKERIDYIVKKYNEKKDEGTI